MCFTTRAVVHGNIPGCVKGGILTIILNFLLAVGLNQVISSIYAYFERFVSFYSHYKIKIKPREEKKKAPNTLEFAE